MNIYNSINPNMVQQLENKTRNVNNNTTKTKDGQSFDQVFGNIVSNSPIQFSKHASMRLDDRNIQLTDNQLQRVEQGMSQAKLKGIKESLVLVDDIALVVSIKNNKVITAVDSKDSNKIFTNIDGAIIV